MGMLRFYWRAIRQHVFRGWAGLTRALMFFVALAIVLERKLLGQEIQFPLSTDTIILVCAAVAILWGVLRAPYLIFEEERHRAEEALGDALGLQNTIDMMMDLRIFHQTHATFQEICEDGELQIRWKVLTRNQIFSRLVKAPWRGHFEDECGNSRLLLNGEEYGRQRLWMVVAIMWAGTMGIPTHAEIQNDQVAEWDALKKQVKWEELSSIPLRDYDQTILEEWFYGLTIASVDLRSWYQRLCRGEYER
jgi:hypothetical protein